MNVFDIIGPVMIGPSSSHTAGAVRIGRVARILLGEEPVRVRVCLHGSFARTYKGHGTDRAIIGGLLGCNTDDPRIRQSLELARQAGMEFRFETADLGNVHPNTAFIEAAGKTGKKVTVLGSSTGGGNIVIKQVNGFDVEFTGQLYTLIILHVDTPGAVAAVTNLLGQNSINIAFMKVFRARKGGNAMMVIETDQHIGEEIAFLVNELPNIAGSTVIAPL